MQMRWFDALSKRGMKSAAGIRDVKCEARDDALVLSAEPGFDRRQPV